MENGLKIKWTENALIELHATIGYLNENWTEKELIQFANSVDNTVEIIARYPEIYPISNKNRKIRKAVVDYHNTIYYRIEKSCVEILSLFSTKQNPGKLKSRK